MSSYLIPPAYGDFDKALRTLFDGYGFGGVAVKSELPVRSLSGALKVKTDFASKSDCRRLQGHVEMIYKHGDLQLSEKVETDGVLQLKGSLEDRLLKGLKLTLEHVYIPDTRHRSAAIRTTYKAPYVHHTGDVEFDFLGQVLRSSVAISYPCGGMIGGEAMYETTLRRVTNASVGVAYAANDFTCSLAYQGLVDFLVSVHQKVNHRLQVGGQFMSSPYRANTTMVVGARYQLTDESFFKAKVSNQGSLGLAYTHRLPNILGPSASLTLGALIDTRRLNQPNHRLGLTLEIN